MPKADILRNIAELCDVSTDWLLTGKGPGPGENIMVEYDNGFSARLKEAFAASGYSLDKLVEIVVIPCHKVENFLEGQIPTAKELLLLAKTLKVSMEWLLSGESSGQSNERKETENEYSRGVIDTLDTISRSIYQSMSDAVEEIKDQIKSR